MLTNAVAGLSPSARATCGVGEAAGEDGAGPVRGGAGRTAERIGRHAAPAAAARTHSTTLRRTTHVRYGASACESSGLRYLGGRPTIHV